MSSVSFDPMAQVYDALRGYPEEVARRIAETIDQEVHADPETRFLEVGVGTGRVALPLVERGRNYTGIDISEKMLGQLVQKLGPTGWQEQALAWGSSPDEDSTRHPQVQRFIHEEKQAALRLVVSDMTHLPFRDQSFDVVIAVHVFHLVGTWQLALQEILRVLRPGGVLLRYWNEDWHLHWEPGSGDLRREWSRIIQQLGGNTQMPGVIEPTVTAWLQAQGLETEQRELLTWQQDITLRTHLESIIHYQATSPWTIPDDLFALSLQRLQDWIAQHSALDEKFPERERLILSKTWKTS